MWPFHQNYWLHLIKVLAIVIWEWFEKATPDFHNQATKTLGAKWLGKSQKWVAQTDGGCCLACPEGCVCVRAAPSSSCLAWPTSVLSSQFQRISELITPILDLRSRLNLGDFGPIRHLKSCSARWTGGFRDGWGILGRIWPIFREFSYLGPSLRSFQFSDSGFLAGVCRNVNLSMWMRLKVGKGITWVRILIKNFNYITNFQKISHFCRNCQQNNHCNNKYIWQMNNSNFKMRKMATTVDSGQECRKSRTGQLRLKNERTGEDTKHKFYFWNIFAHQMYSSPKLTLEYKLHVLLFWCFSVFLM